MNNEKEIERLTNIKTALQTIPPERLNPSILREVLDSHARYLSFVISELKVKAILTPYKKPKIKKWQWLTWASSDKVYSVTSCHYTTEEEARSKLIECGFDISNDFSTINKLTKLLESEIEVDEDDDFVEFIIPDEDNELKTPSPGVRG